MLLFPIMEKGRATASYVSALCIYGTIGWALAYINLPSEIVVLCRGALGTVFILVVLFVRHRCVDWTAIRRNAVWLAVGGVSLGLNWVLLFAAYRVTTVAVASLCNYMFPVILILVAPLVLGEKRSLKKAACAAVAVVGMAMVSGVLEGGMQGATAQGVALGLGAAVFAAVMVLCNKNLKNISGLEPAAAQLAFATLAVLPFVVVNNMGQSLDPDALSVVLVVLLGVVHTGVAYWLYFGSLAGLSAQTVAVLGYVEPAVAVLISTVVLHESLSIIGWVGAALIIGAAALSEVIE